MSEIFRDKFHGLVLRGYSLVPNSALETTIAVYTSEISQTILAEHSDIVDQWLQKLHQEYIRQKKMCDFENDSVACFTVAEYEEFEKHMKSWENGGIINIKLPSGKRISVSQKPLFIVKMTKSQVCEECGLSVPISISLPKHYMEKHPEMIEKITIPN